MKSIEIISLRTTMNLEPQVYTDLYAMCQEVKESSEPYADLYTNADAPGDLAIILLWGGRSRKREKSNLGQRLSAALKRFGLVDHIVWVTTEKGIGTG